MTKTCDHCHGPIPSERAKHPKARFCRDACRAAWHRKHALPGTVARIVQLASGRWSVTVHFSDLPTTINRGASVSLQTDPRTRTYAATRENRE